MNKKKLLRLYREEGLAVRRRRGRTRAPMALPDGPNQRWSLDFVADTLSWGRRFRILCIVDDFTREALALVVDTSIGGHRLAPRAGRPNRPARQASDHRQRQRHGDDQPSHAGMDQPNRRRLALHRAGQAAAERLRRELQRQAARRVLERGGLRQPGAGKAILLSLNCADRAWSPYDKKSFAAF